MASIDFGYGKTYDWSSTYWSTLTNVQDTNITDYNTSDGWKILSFNTSIDVNKTWDTDFTGWNAFGPSGSASISGGVLKFTFPTAGNWGYTQSANLATDTTTTMAQLCRAVTPSESTLTTTPWLGVVMDSYSGLGVPFMVARKKSATELQLNQWVANPLTEVGIVPLDTSRYHIMLATVNASKLSLFFFDGAYVGSYTAGTYTSVYLQLGGGKAATTDIAGTVEHWVRWTKRVTTNLPWETSDGILESDATHAVYDAGAGRKWSTVTWTNDTSNGTAITYQVRCAATLGGLAGASYETIASSGDSIVTKDRFIQVKITMADGSSGQYTPIVKDLTLTDEAAPSMRTSICFIN